LLRRKNHPGAKYDGPVSQAYQGVWLKPVLTDIEKEIPGKVLHRKTIRSSLGVVERRNGYPRHPDSFPNF